MSDRVNPGDSARNRWRAEKYNTLDEMALAFKQQRAKVNSGFPIGSFGTLPALSVLAQVPDDDDDIGIRCPVKLILPDGAPGPLDPNDDPEGVAARPAIFALAPTGGDTAEAVGITKFAIPAGGIGPVYVSGLVLCTVNITDTAHRFATLSSSLTALDSATGGPVRIVWPAPADGTGEQPCLVLLNAGSGSISSADPWIWMEITGNAGGAEPATTYSWKQKKLDNATDLFVDVSPPVTGTNTLKRAPSNTPSPVAGVLPVIPNGQVVLARPSPTDPAWYETLAPGGMQTIEFHRYRYNFLTCEETDTTIRITGRDLTIEEL